MITIDEYHKRLLELSKEYEKNGNREWFKKEKEKLEKIKIKKRRKIAIKPIEKVHTYYIYESELYNSISPAIMDGHKSIKVY
jgi:hypothetical protein